MTLLLVRLRGIAEVGFHFAETAGEEFGGIFVGEGGHDDAVLAAFPIGGSGDFVLGGELQGIDDAKDFEEIPSGAGGVSEGELDFFVRPDDEDGADGGFIVRVGVDHVIEGGHLLLGIGDDGEVHHAGLGFIDVFDPAVVGIERVHADSDDLDVALLEFLFDFGDHAEFGGADGGIVGRVREKDSPARSEPLVEVDGSVRGFRGEIGGEIAESECHILWVRSVFTVILLDRPRVGQD